MPAMPRPIRARVTVKSVTKRPCPNFKVGDTWIVQQGITPNGMCSRVYYSVAFAMQAMMDANAPEAERNTAEVSCPDTRHLLVYEVRRLGPEEEG